MAVLPASTPRTERQNALSLPLLEGTMHLRTRAGSASRLTLPCLTFLTGSENMMFVIPLGPVLLKPLLARRGSIWVSRSEAKAERARRNSHISKALLTGSLTPATRISPRMAESSSLTRPVDKRLWRQLRRWHPRAYEF